jgi:hypothetical protein
MHALIEKERQDGGWDIESKDRTTGGLRLIEAKGRAAVQSTITVINRRKIGFTVFNRYVERCMIVLQRMNKWQI